MPSYTPTFGAGDAVAAQSLYNLKTFTDWLTANGLSGRGIISEIGIPGSSRPGTDPIAGSGTNATYDPAWELVLQQVYEGMNRSSLHTTVWNASEWNVDLRAYRTGDSNNGVLNYRTTVSGVIENNLTNGTYRRGVNYAGGEFSDQGPNGVLTRSHTSQPNAGYYYPYPASFAVLAARGLDLVRIPFRWERVQPVLLQPLNSAEMTALAASVSAALSAGMTVMLDMHNYARYDSVADGTAGHVFNLGQPAPASQTYMGTTSSVGGTMNAAYADVWTRLSTYFTTTPFASYASSGKVWFDIMNEPHDLSGGRSDWQAACQVAVEAIRLVTQACKVAVEGYNYATVPDWVNQNGATPWLTETIPAGQTGAGTARNTDANIVWNGHLYLDPRTNGYDGGYQDTYANELSYAQGQGFASWTTSGYVAPSAGNSLQAGLRTLFSTEFDSTGDFSGTYDSVTANSNTVTIPFAVTGQGNFMKVVSSTTSDEGGVRKNLPGGNNSRILFMGGFSVDPTTQPNPGSTSCITHAWDNAGTNDLLEVRVVGAAGGGYKLILQNKAAGTQAAGTTTFALGQYYDFQVVLNDTGLALYAAAQNGVLPSTPEASIAGTFAGKYFGLWQMGKFYGNDPITTYYSRAQAGTQATYYAPPNGGLIAAPTVTTSYRSFTIDAQVNTASLSTRTSPFAMDASIRKTASRSFTMDASVVSTGPGRLRALTLDAIIGARHAAVFTMDALVSGAPVGTQVTAPKPVAADLTLRDIVSLMQNLTGNKDAEAENLFRNYANLAQKDLERDFSDHPNLRSSEQFVLVPGQDLSYAMPADFKNERFVRIVSPTIFSHQLGYVPYERFRSMVTDYRLAVPGVPYNWYWAPENASQIHVFPVPDRAYVMQLDYDRYAPDLLADTDVPFFGKEFQHVCAYRALWYYYGSSPIVEIDLADKWDQQFEVAKRQIRKAYQRRTFERVKAQYANDSYNYGSWR